MSDFVKNNGRQRLREFGCPDITMKDVRDVAEALSMDGGEAGAKGSRKFESFVKPGHLSNKPPKSRVIGFIRLQGKSREAVFGNLRFLKG